MGNRNNAPGELLEECIVKRLDGDIDRAHRRAASQMVDHVEEFGAVDGESRIPCCLKEVNRNGSGHVALCAEEGRCRLLGPRGAAPGSFHRPCTERDR